MRRIQLTKGASAIIDDDCVALLSRFSWRLNSYGYAITNIAREDGSRTAIAMHRMIVGRDIGDLQVDHINGDRLDNRRANLRLCSFTENTRNRGMHKNNKSGFKGIYAKRSRWVAAIKLNYRRIYLGAYPTPEEAHEVYCLWADMLHGEFANYGDS
ncbi:HNH endonuclease [Burkholderia gladioli]|uniref:HNH endonuclease n=1 Tax=Burkholderia gladioli TaxID=28095 RepID=UPI001CC4DDE3|nr:HNH endonuclease [Burkholderia gladioli]